MKKKKTRKKAVINENEESIWNKIEYIFDVIKSRDRFGVPVELNLKGSKTHTTVPGGILSIAFIFILSCYVILKFIIIYYHANWMLYQ